MKHVLIPALIAGSIFGVQASNATNLITGAHPDSIPSGYDGTFSGGTVNTGTSSEFVSNTFYIDVTKSYRLSYTAGSNTPSGGIYISTLPNPLSLSTRNG